MSNIDLIRFASDMSKVDVPEGYAQLQLYKDFNAVFLGESSPAQGKRVLSTIIRWGGLWMPVAQVVPDQPTDIHATMVAAGAQDLCKKIVTGLIQEPKPTIEEEEDQDGD